MCDYSLQHIASRPAKVGDELMTTRFVDSITRGFCAIGEPDVAVCLLPGTELAFENEPEFGHVLAWLFRRPRKLGGKVARFRQIDIHVPHTHHDALEFANGKTVLLTRLRTGQRAVVLQLPVDKHAAADSVIATRQRVAPVSASAAEVR